MTAAAITTPREVFPKVDVPARLVIEDIDVRAKFPHFFTTASAAGSSTASPYADDYYRRERLPASRGGHHHMAGHGAAPATGGSSGWVKFIGAVAIALILFWFISHTSFSVNIGGAGNPPAANVVVTTPPPAAPRSVVMPPRRVIPPGSGQVTINREFDTGQEYCNAHVPGTTFSHWIGSGGDRKARCTD